MAAPTSGEIQGVEPARLVLGVVVLPVLLFGGAMLWVGSVRDRLPEPMATHWNAAGDVNGTMTFGAFLTFPVTMAGVLWLFGAVMVALGRTSRVRFRYQRAAMAWCTGSVAFAAATMVATVAANLDASTATDAQLAPVMVLVMLGVGALAAAGAWVVAGSPPPPDPTRPGIDAGPDIEPVELRADEHPVWHEHLTSGLLTAITVAMVVVGLGLLTVNTLLGALVVVTGLCCAPLASVTAVVDGRGLAVRFGPFGWPVKRIALATIAAVHAGDIEPLQWGGWGYRMMPGRSAVVLRRGPGLMLELTDGRAFAVTVDRPEPGAALLEAYRRREVDVRPPR